MKIILSNKFKTVHFHLLFWLLVWFIMSLWAGQGSRLSEYLIKNIAILLPMAAIVYINWFFLFPKFFKIKKYWKYGILAVLLVYLIYYIAEILIQYCALVFPNIRCNMIRWMIIRGGLQFLPWEKGQKVKCSALSINVHSEMSSLFRCESIMQQFCNNLAIV